jgi:hypothetical protein
MLLGDHDRLEFRLDAWNQPSEPDYVLFELGHPQVLRADLLQVFVKAASWVVAADLWAVEDLPVLPGQFFPQPSTPLGVTRLKRANGYHVATYLARTRELEAG